MEWKIQMIVTTLVSLWITEATGLLLDSNLVVQEETEPHHVIQIQPWEDVQSLYDYVRRPRSALPTTELDQEVDLPHDLKDDYMVHDDEGLVQELGELKTPSESQAVSEDHSTITIPNIDLDPHMISQTKYENIQSPSPLNIQDVDPQMNLLTNTDQMLSYSPDNIQESSFLKQPLRPIALLDLPNYRLPINRCPAICEVRDNFGRCRLDLECLYHYAGHIHQKQQQETMDW
ncbi:unnamed protein product [Meganyctiphanes norvegica]|uniref:Uncharacterized protein n=1 Tax=Meganyctiphanes norvegica TaxID=48144 RepID=A0AAV2SLS8_MEGNR